VLQHFASPTLAALVMVCRLVPGLLLSPIAGALLDRMQPVRLISADLATRGRHPHLSGGTRRQRRPDALAGRAPIRAEGVGERDGVLLPDVPRVQKVDGSDFCAVEVQTEQQWRQRAARRGDNIRRG
jgi:hypothetical protein